MKILKLIIFFLFVYLLLVKSVVLKHLACNSILDAVAYFNSIAENNVNLFQFNFTISPFDEGGNVVFDGLINPLNNTESMIEIYGPIFYPMINMQMLQLINAISAIIIKLKKCTHDWVLQDIGFRLMVTFLLVQSTISN
ncbi:hypothetical protein ACTFIW_000204 [Dictyostelium discoideum]